MRFNQKEFGQRLRNRRVALHTTQEELAEKIHVDKQHISRMERGVKALSIDLLIEISDALDVNIDYLLTGSKKNHKIRAELESIVNRLNDLIHNV